MSKTNVKKYYWLRLKDGFFDDKVIKKLRKIAGGDTYVIIYLKMQLLSIKTEGKLFFEGVENSFEEELALELDEDEENVKVTVSYLEKMGLIESATTDQYLLPEVLKLIGSESESAERVRRHRENKKNKLLQCNDTVTDGNNIVQESNTEKEIEIEIEIYNKNNVQQDCTAKVSKKELDNFFEFIWNLYPNPKGKGQVKEAKKKILFEIGQAHLARAIQRYKTELAKDEWRKAQNGSTFFNSGYIDYLDNNFKPNEHQPKSKNQFNNFEQRDYTPEQYSKIEQKMINRAKNTHK